LKQYIDLSTALRAKGTSNFESDFLKLMNNAVYGKCLESIEGRVDIHIVTDAEKGMKFKLAALPM
jgi:hypothetical protein